MENVLREILKNNKYFEEINPDRYVPEFLGLIVNGVVVYHVNWIDIVENEIAKQGKENIYRIMLKGRIDNGLEINLSALTREYCINQIIDKTQYDYDINELLAGNDNNLLGRFIKTLMDENSTEDAEIRNKALRYGIEAFLGVGEE